ncbi:MAG: autotransporter-associated beta strand repeat-containing protein [Chthoniobacteraceae bacterium]
MVTALPLDLWTARGASETWTGTATTGNWTDATWSPDAAAPGATSGTTNTDTATFGSSGASTITVDSYRNLQNITFNGSSAFTLSTGTLYLTAGGVVQNTGSAAQIISAPIVLEGNYSFTSSASNAANTLVFSTGGITGAATTGNTFSLTLGGANAGTNTISSVIGDGTGGGNLALVKNDAGLWVLSGTNTFTGGDTLNSGILSINADANLGASTSAVTLNGGTLRTTAGITNTHAFTIGASGGTINVSTTGQYFFNTANTLLGSGTLTLTGNGTLVANTGNLRVAQTNTFNGNVILQGGGTFEYGVQGAVDPTATFTLNNQGELAVQGSSAVNMANSLTVNGGTNSVLSFENGTLGIFSGAITLNANLTIGLRDWYNYGTVRGGTVSGNISGTGGLTINSGTGTTGTLTLSGTNTYAGSTTIASATVTVAGNQTGANSNYLLQPGSTLILNGNTGSLPTNTTLALNGAGFTYQGSTTGSTLDASGYTISGSNEVNFTSIYGTSGTTTLTLPSLARSVGMTENFTASGGTNGTTNLITLSTAPTSTGTLLDKGEFFSGTDYAVYDAAGYLRAFNYSTDTNGVIAAGGTTLGTVTALSNVNLTGAVTAQTTAQIDTLKLGTTNGLTLASSQILTVDSLLKSGANAATISGGTGIQASSNGELVIRTNASGDTLTIASAILANGTNALTKSGSGTLVISGTNTYTGNTYLNLGTIDVQNASAFGTGTLVLNGGQVNNNGSSALTLANNIYVPAGMSAQFKASSTSGNGLGDSGALTGSGTLTLLSAGTNSTAFLSGDLSEFTGTLVANTVNNGSNLNIGGGTAASNNLGQATLQLTGGNSSNRRLAGWGGILQVGALSGTVGTFNGGNLEVGALNTNTTFGGMSINGGWSLIKVGTGTLTLNGGTVYTGSSGGIQANGGTIAIDLSNLAASTSLWSAPLKVGGGTFSLFAKPNVTSTQAFTSTTINSGASAITASTNGGGGSVLLTLNGLTRNAGGTVDFTLPSGAQSSTNGITTTSTTLVSNNVLVSAATNGIAFATVGGTDWASLSGNNIVGYSKVGSYATGAANYLAASNVDVTNGDSVSGVTANTLRFNAAGDTLTLSGTNIVSTGGILVTSAGTGSSIAGGTLQSGGGEALVLINNGSMDLSTTTIANSTVGASAFTISGAGTTTLSNANTYTGKTYVNVGTVMAGADTSFGVAPSSVTADQLNLNGGTIKLAGAFNFATNRGITLGNNGGTIDTNGFDSTYAGVIAGGVTGTTSANTSYGFGLTKNGSGTLTLTGTNTYGGTTVINGGTVSVSSLATETASGGVASGIGSAPNTAQYLVFNGGTLQYTGAATTTDRRFTLGSSGGTIDASGSGALTWAGNTGSGGTVSNVISISGTGNRTLTLTGSSTASNVLGIALGDSSTSGKSSLVKNGAGTWVLTGTNTYTGATTVNAGTLRVTGSLASGSAVAVSGGATLTGTGTIGGSVTVAGGSTLSTEGALSLVDGSTSTAFKVGSLALGGTSGNLSQLSFDVGSSLNDLLTVVGNLLLNVGGATININSSGAVAGQTYTLISFGSGTGAGFTIGSGSTVGSLTLANTSLSFGVSGTLNVTANSVQLVTTGATAPTTAYWSGVQGTQWNSLNGSSTAANFTTDATGSNSVAALPAPTTDVIFAASGNGAPTNLTNTLGQDFEIKSLTFSSGLGAASITGSNSLTVDAGGITLQSTNGGVTLGMTTLALGADETFTNASSNNLTVAAVISGSHALTVNNTGTGKTVFSGVNTYTGGTTLTTGLLQMSGNSTSSSNGGLGAISGAFTVNGGTLDLNDTTQGVGNLTGTGGTIVNNGSSAVTFTIGNGNGTGGNYQGVIANNNNAGLGVVALTKTGTGTIQLSGANTYTGATNINGGVLQISNLGNLGSATSAIGFKGGALEILTSGFDLTRAITMNGAATILNDSGALTIGTSITNAGNLFTIGGAGTTGISGAITGTGGFYKTGSGTVNITGTSNTYTGATTIDQGTLNLSGSYSGSSTFTVSNAGTLNVTGTLTSTNTMTIGNRSGAGSLTLNGGTLTVGATNITAGFVISNSAAATDTAAASVTINSGTLTSNGDVDVGIGGTQTALLTMNGGTVNVGTTVEKWMKIGAFDTISATVNLTSGTINLDTNTDIRFTTDGGAGTNVFNQNGGNIVSFSDNGVTHGGSTALDMQYAGNSSTNNTYNLNAGTLTIGQVTSSAVSGTRTFNFNGGTLQVASSATASTFFNLGGGNSFANVRNGGAIIDTNGYSVTVAQALIHSNVAGDNATDGGLIKKGAGAMTLGGANTYTGPTMVKAGALIVSNSLSSSSTVTIGDASNLTTSAVLAGSVTGSNVGSVILGAAAGNSGAKLSPSNGSNGSASAGALGSLITINGNLTITSGSGAHLQMAVGRAVTGQDSSLANDLSDRLVVSGSISLSGDLDISLLSATGYALSQGDVMYLILNNGSSAVSGTFDSINGVGSGIGQDALFSVGGLSFKISYTADAGGVAFDGGGNNVALMVMAVPEPRTWLLILGGAGLVRLRRKNFFRAVV